MVQPLIAKLLYPWPEHKNAKPDIRGAEPGLPTNTDE